MKLSIDWGSPPPDLSRFSQLFQAKKELFFRAAMSYIVKDVVQGILARKAITGGSFPQLADSTVARKGHDKALVDKGLFSDEYTYDQLNRWREDQGIITVKPVTAPAENRWGLLSRAIKGIAATEKDGGFHRYSSGDRSERDTPRNRVASYLQETGLPNGKKFMFFGVSKDSEDTIMAMIDIMVEETLEQM